LNLRVDGEAAIVENEFVVRVGYKPQKRSEKSQKYIKNGPKSKSMQNTDRSVGFVGIFSGSIRRTGGPLKPDFGLSG
jgi:hypothetical protein